MSPKRHPDFVDDWKIEKTRFAVTLAMVGGEQMRGHIFVQPSAYRNMGREEPADMFNNPEPFFPLAMAGEGSVVLIAKDRVLEVSGIPTPDGDDARRIAVPVALLQITLVGGETRIGSVLLEVPADRPRVLDFLNHYTDRFVALYAADGVRLLNRAMIDRVSPLE